MKVQPSESWTVSVIVKTTTHSTTSRKYPLKHRGKLFKLFWNSPPLRAKILNPQGKNW